MTKPEPIKFVAANSWGNCMNDEFTAFLQSEWCVDADVIALSEVFYAPAHTIDAVCHNNSWKQQLNSRTLVLNAVGDSYHNHYTPNSTGRDHTCTKTGLEFEDIDFGNMLFVRKDRKAIWHDIEVFPGVTTDSIEIETRYGHGTILRQNGVMNGIFHFHGLWLLGNTKGDSPYRDQQSGCFLEEVAYLKKVYGIEKIVFGGDFNLDHDTTALQMFVDAGYRNLNVEFRIDNTRTGLYREYGKPGRSMHADYMFACPNTKVVEYHAPDIPISDHRPLIVKFF